MDKNEPFSWHKAGESKAVAPVKRAAELRLYGLNACLAAFAKRPEDLRKVYLSEARLGALREVLAYCVRQRLGYRVVAEDDLRRLASSSHHEGVVFDLVPPVVPALDQLIEALGRDRPALLLWLDGVGNPHNLGAVLRSSAHFGAAAVLLPPGSGLGLSGAACRVAEGGAEAVPLIRLQDAEDAQRHLQEAGFVLAATLPTGGQSLYERALPKRLLLVFGAETSGIGTQLLDRCALRLGIPGTGDVESLNIASAASVFIAEWRRIHPHG